MSAIDPKRTSKCFQTTPSKAPVLATTMADPGVSRAAMRRREFIAFVGAAVALPRVVCAQQPIPVIVFFNSGTPSTNVKNLAAFRDGLNRAGLVEGQNVAIEFVWAENRFDGLETLAAEVIARRPSVIISNTLEPSYRPQQYRSCLPPAAIRSGTDWYQA